MLRKTHLSSVKEGELFFRVGESGPVRTSYQVEVLVNPVGWRHEEANEPVFVIEEDDDIPEEMDARE
jgi:hypothetical protein